jgi:hypothetical protein
MRMMKRAMTALCAPALALALPASAGARISEVGFSSSSATPACPSSPCLAVSRTTGYQAKTSTSHGPDTIPRDGRIVAWSISLGKPNKKQTTFFNTNEGGPASAQITILRPRKKLFYQVMAVSPVVQLQSYFGQTAQFPLDTSIAVKKGWVVALTVPTWAPALAIGFSNTTSWRASRQKKQCNNTTLQTAQQRVGQQAQYFCLYKTARLTYTATLISTP